MRLTKVLVAVALCAPMIATAQAPRKRPVTAPAAEAPHRAHRESVHDQLSGQGYGVAGCGLGSIAFGPKSGPIQIVAATLNGIGGQTFAITTGTSNCDIPTMGHQAAVFVEVNREILAKDSARGQGETVEGLAALLHCSDSKALGHDMQSNFEQIFKKENDSYDAVRAILSTIEASPALKSTCLTNG